MPSKMKKQRRTPEQIVEDLQNKKMAAAAAAKKKSSQLQAQIRDAKAKIAEKDRKEDTHIKVVNGALAFTFFKHHPELAKQYTDWVNNSSEPAATIEKIISRLPEQNSSKSEAPPIKEDFAEELTG